MLPPAQADIVPTRPGFWASIREALRGSHQDYTSGSLNRAILLLAIPMVLEMVLESLFAVVDIFWVGRLGANAVATVGITESMLALAMAIGIGLAISTTAMVARRIGEKDPEDAAISAVQAVVLGLLVSLGIGIPAFLFAPSLLHLMGASPEIVATGSGYARIALGGCGAIIMLFLNNAIFRGAGDAAVAMHLLWVSNIINLILDPCLIFGLGPFPHLGVTGAALATFTGRSIGVLYQFYRLLHGTERIRVFVRHLRVSPEVLWRLLRISSTGILQFAIANASWIGLVRIVSLFGAAAVAGYTISIRIVIFFILPSWGLSNAAATLVGQNLGAGRPDRAEQAVWRTGFYNMLFLGIIGIIFFIFADPVVRIFVSDPEVIPVAVRALRTFSCGNVGFAYGMVMLQSFNGAGDTITPTIVNFFGFWVLELPAAWWLATRTSLHAEGAFLAIVIAECAVAGASAILFRRGRWKKQII
ncbi:MATE family efflux transporter [Paracidobacterium acidisoli]|uniref:Multidrug-efflux transporter n=1 Tax=Paracidobacterium acidisoli TaxID=2303751 RepID=A0A372ITP7_9BACT|nr:MATE family efflux transporter [Paracidobacterium acidisoli]MBT9329685.1 MATE family efflux transporter [Paracidobacterium acidisoli]